jgi:alkaline phosphatase
VVENQYGNALVADAFNGLAERNKPKQQRSEPKPEPEPVYKRLARLERQAGEQGYNMRAEGGQIDLWTHREPTPGQLGTLHTFPFNDNGIQAAFAWLERAKDRPEA